jgi:UDP-glucuronate 4-epimerase
MERKNVVAPKMWLKRVSIFISLLICISVATHYQYIWAEYVGSTTANIPLSYRRVLSGDDRILITGAAGFIGFTLINELKALGVNHIVGLDSFSTYYSPSYKYQRSWKLFLDHGIDIVRGDVCDDNLLTDLFQKHNFTHIMHLSASANVRFSVEEPYTVIQNNVVCFQNILEHIRSIAERSGPIPHFVWASSSSVYGTNDKVPFEETDSVDRPASLYGASKRMNELQAKVYNHIFKIPSIGLRFFTVYGPWGRPDMAPYKFTEKIMNGDSITVFNEGLMKRDFTYVTDIAKGIIAALEFRSSDFRVFNLGNTQPVALDYFIKTIERLVGKDAKKKFALSNVDLPITYSSNSLTRASLGWSPTISIEDGMKLFVDWFVKTDIAVMPCAAECSASRQCTKSIYDGVLEISRELTKSCSVVVYTVVVDESYNTDGNKNAASVKSISQNCSIAFVAKGSKISIDRQAWQVVEVEGFREASKTDILLPKYNPKFFFRETVLFAYYTSHPNMLPFASEEHILQHMTCGGSSDASIGVFITPSTLTPSTLSTSPSVPSKFVGLSQKHAYAKYFSSTGKSSHSSIDSRSIVHNLRNAHGHDTRCRWINENIIWDISGQEDASLQFVVGSQVPDAKHGCFDAGADTLVKVFNNNFKL